MDSQLVILLSAFVMGGIAILWLGYLHVRQWDRVFFSAPALKKLVMLQGSLPNKEIGGLLFGESTFGHYYVRDVTTVENISGISHKTYVPDTEEAREQLRTAGRNGWHLLGDWHSHPKGAPILSAEDITVVRRRREICKRNIVVMILSPQGIGVWLVRRKDIRQQSNANASRKRGVDCNKGRRQSLCHD